MNDHWLLAVKTSLSQFCVDLNHCLLFIGSIMTRFVVSPGIIIVIKVSLLIKLKSELVIVALKIEQTK